MEIWNAFLKLFHKPEPEPLCETTGCTQRCSPTCAEGRGTCSVQRKHFVKGGVCCMSCYSFCDDCDGPFYWEGLQWYEDKDDEDGYVLCHCCQIRRG